MGGISGCSPFAIFPWRVKIRKLDVHDTWLSTSTLQETWVGLSPGCRAWGYGGWGSSPSIPPPSTIRTRMVPPPDPTYAGPGRTLPVDGSWGELKASSWDRGLFVGLSCVTSGQWLPLSGPQPKGSGRMPGRLWCADELQAPPAHTSLVSFLGSLQGAGCLLGVLAENHGVGVWTPGCGQKSSESFLGHRRLGTRGAERAGVG